MKIRDVGHAFLDSAARGAQFDGASLIQYLNPVVLGQDPRDRERLYQALWERAALQESGPDLVAHPRLPAQAEPPVPREPSEIDSTRALASPSLTPWR
jgi:hypothetical protein